MKGRSRRFKSHCVQCTPENSNDSDFIFPRSSRKGTHPGEIVNLFYLLMSSLPTFDDDISLFSIDTQATAFDARAARESLYFMKEALGSWCAPLENINRLSARVKS